MQPSDLQTLDDVLAELLKARQQHLNMSSTHDGYAKILEELDELRDEVKKRDPDRDRMKAEAIQVAAMAVRFISDICGED